MFSERCVVISIAVGTKGAERSTTEDDMRCDLDEDAKEVYLVELGSLHSFTTPRSYMHGLRSRSQYGSLIPYFTHAAMLKGKLHALHINKQELDDRYDSASNIHKDTTRWIREDNEDQGLYLNRRGGSIERWLKVRIEIVKSLRAAQAEMNQARTESKRRQLWLRADEDDEDGGLGPACSAWTGN